jgi:hypothetical protein
MSNWLSGPWFCLDKNRYPKFLIIGAQKAGTTTLFDLLNGCPMFCGSLDKEPGYFTDDISYRQGKEWYLRQFERCSRAAIKFEATPFYLYHPETAKRIFSFNPHMKFIVMLREPAARCYSAWNMFRRFNESSPRQIYDKFVKDSNPSIRDAVSKLLFAEHYPSFKQAVEEDVERYLSRSVDIEPSFVRRGIYCEQIERYLEYFSLDSFLFLEQRELNLPVALIQKVSDFLNVAIDVSAVRSVIVSNVGDYPPGSAEIEATLVILRKFYGPYNERLFTLIGNRYDWNDV